ncbi:hypothetical protein RRG08_018622, partial [Elysia crispata]
MVLLRVSLDIRSTFSSLAISLLCLASGTVSKVLSESRASPPRAGAYPFRNTSLSWGARVDDLVGRLTDHEMILQMSHGGRSPETGPAPAIPRLGIGAYVWNTECLRGDVGALENATAFPQAIGLAASFSPGLIYRVASATGREVRGKHNDFVQRGVYASLTGASCFSPVINIVRDGRWGRVQETYGEDPYLTGLLAEHFVSGLQGKDERFIQASAGCKHFDAYAGPEKGRGGFNAKVTERDLRMTFLPAFRKCVEAGTYSVMCSYNAINGVPACANKRLLTDILRKEWKFKGYVVSDDTAVEQVKTLQKYVNTSVDAAAVCVNAGTNLELSATLRQSMFLYIDEALGEGKLSSEILRDRTRPLFYTRMRLGEFDPPDLNPYYYLDSSVVETKAHRALALEAAIKSYVLLKNGNGLLPLKDLSKFEKVVLLGPMADNTNQLFGDYAPNTSPAYKTTPLDGLRQLFSVKHETVCSDGTPCSQYKQETVKGLVPGADLLFVALGTGQAVEAEARDRPNLELPGRQKDLLLDVMRYNKDAPIVLLLYNAGPLNVSFADSNPRVSAILEGFFPAQEAGTSLAAVLTNKGGNSGPAGRLPVTWPLQASQLAPISDYSMTGRTYRYMTSDPLYPFGYGLSYTTFVYRSLSLAAETVQGHHDLNATLIVENSGDISSDE